jgi:probable rRNA maturation factor
LISLRNHQRRVPLDLPWLRRFAAVALKECLRHSADGRFALRGFEEISIAIVSDRRIAQVHLDFMGLSGPTDVITFEYGEIVISAETAWAYAADFDLPVNHEVALYIVHGFLHLNGFDDRTRGGHVRMHRTQERIMKTCLGRLTAD